MELSIIVVSYNTRDLTCECLRSLLDRTRGVDYEVLVVDNASDDGSAETIASNFPDVALTALEDNVGFARANNLAAKRARGEYLLLLNPDTVVLDDAVQSLVSFARAHPRNGIWGGRTLFADGSLNPSSCWGRSTLWSTFSMFLGISALFRRTRLFDPESLGAWRRDSVREVDIVSGCLLLIRRTLWEELGGFDPSFFMYGEDADLCLRARGLGARPAITPGSTIIHHGGASERVRADKLVRVFGARVRLIRRHWPRWKVRLGVRLVVARAGSRSLGWWVLGRLGHASGVQSHRCWAEVWHRRGEWSGSGSTGDVGAGDAGPGVSPPDASTDRAGLGHPSADAPAE